MNTQSERNLVPFAFGENLVRSMLDEAGNPWFVAKDVALALNYQWNGQSCIAHVPEEWRGVRSVLTPSGTQEMLMLSEQGLYFFLGRSDKPKALSFQKWLAGEVLPALRRTGTYTMPNANKLRGERTGMPDVPEVYSLRQGIRLRVWESALRCASLEEEGWDFAVQCFVHICRMLAAGPLPRPVHDEETRRIVQFAEEMNTAASTPLSCTTLSHPGGAASSTSPCRASTSSAGSCPPVLPGASAAARASTSVCA